MNDATHRRTTGGEGGSSPPPEPLRGGGFEDLVNINLYMKSCINGVEKVEKNAQRGQKACPGGGKIAQERGGDFLIGEQELRPWEILPVDARPL